MIFAVFLEILGDLHRQLAGRLEDQRARHPRPAAALVQDVDHRQHEAGGLAGAGLGDADQVLAHQHGGDGRGAGSGSVRHSRCRQPRGAIRQKGRDRQKTFKIRKIRAPSSGAAAVSRLCRRTSESQCLNLGMRMRKRSISHRSPIRDSTAWRCTQICWSGRIAGKSRRRSRARGSPHRTSPGPGPHPTG